MSTKKSKLTQEGLKEFEAELEDLRTNKRKEVAEKIKVAREQGDLSENAEYDSAKEEQAEIEARIKKLEALLEDVEIINVDDFTGDEVLPGCRVTLFDKTENEVVVYSIKGSAEADPLNNIISDESLMGASLINKKVGDTAVVEAPAGLFEYVIQEIELM